MVAHPYAHTAYWPRLGTAGGDIEGEKGLLSGRRNMLTQLWCCPREAW